MEEQRLKDEIFIIKKGAKKNILLYFYSSLCFINKNSKTEMKNVVERK